MPRVWNERQLSAADRAGGGGGCDPGGVGERILDAQTCGECGSMTSVLVHEIEAPAAIPDRRNYLNQTHGLKSWLLTGDHKRIAILYLLGVSFFFAVGGLLAFALR